MNLIALSTIREKRWQEAILSTASYFGLLPNQIVQDLLNWAFLKTLTEHTKQPYVFRGGTSLSQAFQIIDRFSEDIDLSLQEFKSGYAFAITSSLNSLIRPRPSDLPSQIFIISRQIRTINFMNSPFLHW
jgi:hypothetical protein